MRPFTVCLLLLTLTASPAGATEELPRRGFFGVMVTPADGGGVAVRQPIPGSTAAAIGLEPGDVITEIDGVAVADTGQFVRLIGGRLAGEEVRCVFRRADEVHERSVRLTAFPGEDLAHSRVEYGHVALEPGVRLRTITTIPRDATGPVPAVLFIQGLGCGSIDQPFAGARDTFVSLVHHVAAAGYATVRVEKSGIGDSEGPPCADIDFTTELAGYRAALEALGAHPQVDATRLVLFGHSMGGVMAPRIAVDRPVRGVIVYGTIAKNFLEYLIENHRRQLPREGLTLLEGEHSGRLYQAYMSRFLLDEMTPGEIEATFPTLAGGVSLADGDRFAGRHASFFHQLYAMAILETWAAVDAHVLSIHGAYDWVSARDDHEMIAAAVNETNSGHGRFVSLPGLDHAFTRHASLEDSYRDYPNGARTAEPGETIVGWLRRVAAP